MIKMIYLLLVLIGAFNIYHHFVTNGFIVLNKMINLNKALSYFIPYFTSYFILIAFAINQTKSEFLSKHDMNKIKYHLKDFLNRYIYHIFIMPIIVLFLILYSGEIFGLKEATYYLYFTFAHLFMGIIAHEIFWQEYIFNQFVNKIGKSISIVIVAIIYSLNYSVFLQSGISYLSSSASDFVFCLPYFIFFIFLRIFCCIIYIQSNNIYYSILFHYVQYLIFVFFLIIIYKF
jgi:membrane protease YdiL (CAAX protease family)